MQNIAESQSDTYHEFLKSKRIRLEPKGINVALDELHPKLFDFQKYVTKWALHKGRSALFLDTGLGKTFCQLEWARLINDYVLIVAPLSVARQTVKEATKIDIDVKYIRNRSEINSHKIYITNYEMLENVYDPIFNGVVLDESSILKSIDGKTKKKILKFFNKTPYRLACTATPSPNDIIELGNHTEFLGICKQQEMLGEWFIHANKITEKFMPNGDIYKIKMSNKKGVEWRLKNYGKKYFYEWLTNWAMSMKMPSDLGFEDDGYVLPELNIHTHFIKTDYKPDGLLFFNGLHGIQNRAEIRGKTIKYKVKKALEIINDNEQWVIWCGLNKESNEMKKLIGGSVEIQGSDSPDYKAEMIENFQDGKYNILITKPKIAGFGMNLQNAHNMIFLGLSDSWEAYYQCIRREWRYGQEKPVNVHIVLSDLEREIYNNVQRKEQISKTLHHELIKNVANYEIKALKGGDMDITIDHDTDIYKGNKFTAMLGDSSLRLKEIPNESIDLSVYSPPFADLYTYSNSERDLGNSRSWDEFFQHYEFIIKEILRVTKRGRLSCVHTSEIPAMAQKDGYIGIKDFPGAVIKAHEKEGWIYHGRAIVTKNPQAQAIRTHSKALLFVQLRKDSSDSRPALLDHILIFKKDGKSDVPVNPVKNEEIDNEKWIDWAGGIWTGIAESDTLRYSEARDQDDEKHICPLQLGTIERCIKLYSNPGEMVLTPFGGIGSEAYQALKFKREAILIELKRSYYDIAVKNLLVAEDDRQHNLFRS